jgi:hypothetical protein
MCFAVLCCQVDPPSSLGGRPCLVGTVQCLRAGRVATPHTVVTVSAPLQESLGSLAQELSSGSHHCCAPGCCCCCCCGTTAQEFPFGDPLTTGIQSLRSQIVSGQWCNPELMDRKGCSRRFTCVQWLPTAAAGLHMLVVLFLLLLQHLDPTSLPWLDASSPHSGLTLVPVNSRSTTQ